MTDMRYSRNSAPMAIITIFARPVFILGWNRRALRMAAVETVRYFT